MRFTGLLFRPERFSETTGAPVNRPETRSKDDELPGETSSRSGPMIPPRSGYLPPPERGGSRP